jgi:hypothetical protein
MDGFTFGGTKAAQILAEEIDKIDDKGKTRQLISSLLDNYFKGLKDIQDIRDKKTYETVRFLWRDAYLNKVEQRKDIPTHIQSFMKNIIKARIHQQNKRRMSEVISNTIKYTKQPGVEAEAADRDEKI